MDEGEKQTFWDKARDRLVDISQFIDEDLSNVVLEAKHLATNNADIPDGMPKANLKNLQEDIDEVSKAAKGEDPVKAALASSFLTEIAPKLRELGAKVEIPEPNARIKQEDAGKQILGGDGQSRGEGIA